MRASGVLWLMGWLAVAPTAAASQLIHGRVFDAASGQPVSAVELKLMQGDRLLASTLSDSVGQFALRPRDAGRYQITATRIGYADAQTQSIDVAADQTLAVDLSLSVSVIPLMPITVDAPRDPYLENTGFYERMRTGNGFYLDESAIRRRPAGTFVDLLRSARGVKIQRVGTRQEVYLTSPSCLPQIVVDGVTVRWGGRITPSVQPLEDLVRMGHIDAVEVYRAFSGVPPQYIGPNAHCGTILIWTRH